MEDEDDLMFSFRDVCYARKIDDDSLLVQFYLDDIGLMNSMAVPIGTSFLHDISLMISLRVILRSSNYLVSMNDILGMGKFRLSY